MKGTGKSASLRWPIRICAALVLGLLLVSDCRHAKRAPILVYRWVYIAENLLRDENVDRVRQLLRRVRGAGYNGIVLADFNLKVLDRMPKRYFQNIEKVRKWAKELGLELYPAVCPVGYSNGLLSHDPNLAEGLPVRDALFTASRQTAECTPDPPIAMQNGDFERADENRLAGWELQDDPGRATFVDSTVYHTGGRSLRMENIDRIDPKHGRCRVMQTVALTPFREYHLSVWIRTQGFETPGAVRATLLQPDGRSLCFQEWDLKETQDWTQCHLVFNSLDARRMRLYLGVWEGRGGRLWWDDVRLEEIGLLGVLRRPGCPLTVRGEGGMVYTEGRDFAPVRDAHLTEGDASGDYVLFHDPPVLRLLPGSRISPGSRLRVSYFHNAIIHQEQVSCCLSEPKVEMLLQDGISRVERLFRPKGFLLNHDEIRTANWCAACTARRESPGRLLAENFRRCAAMARKAHPGAELFVWSDMFDPYHNAVDRYYLVNGSWAGSWEGLTKDVVLVNWNYAERRRSLPWFAGRGHRQILAGYYDESPERIRQWIDDCAGVPGVVGVMYTTWQHQYKDLEVFAKAAWGR